jgi:cobalt-zinc-cadmium efflux system protein
VSHGPRPQSDAPSHGDGRARASRRLGWTLALIATYMAAEVAGGLWTNSLALLSDAGHMLSDAAALALSLAALWIARRPPTPERTYGYHRAEILAALVNGAALGAIAVLIFIEAWDRLLAPPTVRGGPMLAIASGGLVVNLAALWLLSADRAHNLNVRGAWLHVLGDTLGSVGAIASGALIWAFGWHWADPLASVLIGVLILVSSWRLLQETVAVLMEGTPAHLDVGTIRQALVAEAGVLDVHDLHVWTITSGLDSLSCHVVAESGACPADLLRRLRTVLQARFGLEHVTIQVETDRIDERCCGQNS